MPKDYYIILGIHSRASTEEIKNAYRRLAKEYHPDHFGDNCSPFLAIQEAYGVLSDPVRRKAYDYEAQNVQKEREQTSYKPRHQSTHFEAEPLIPEEGPVDLGEQSLARSFQICRPSFEELFAWLASNFSPSPRPKAERPKNLTVVITLTPKQAFHGGHVRLRVPIQLPCPTCFGQGGAGFYSCRRCSGKGEFIGEQPIHFNYQAGIADNQVIQLSLERYGFRNQCLYIRFRISDME